MEPFIAHFDESDNFLDGKVLGFGGIVMSASLLTRILPIWEGLRTSLVGAGREVKWGNVSPDGRDKVAALLAAYGAYAVVDVMLDERHMIRRSARDHYRIGLRWAIGRTTDLATTKPDVGRHQVIVDRVPEAKVRLRYFDERLAWAIGRTRTYAHHEYADLYRTGNGRSGVPVLRDRGFYPSLLEADATFNPLLEIADIVVGGVTRWAVAAFEGKQDQRLETFVETLVPALTLPGTQLGCDIFCPNWERSRFWEARTGLLGSLKTWSKAG